MASPVDTAGKLFNENLPDAPVLNGVAGSLIDLLTACLVTGFGLRTAVSLVVSGGVATLTLANEAKNANRLHTVVLVEGVTGALTALNGEQKITFASPTELKFATAAADGTATGAITVKTAPAGWEKKFPGRVESMFSALQNVVPSHLLDGALYDFKGAQATGIASEDGDKAFDQEEFPTPPALPGLQVVRLS